MSLTKTNKSIIHTLTSNKIYTILCLILFGILLITLLLCIVKKCDKCDKCSISTEQFDNNMIVDARNYNTEEIKYKDRVYVVKGSDFIVNDKSVRLNGVVKKLRVDDIVIGEEAPGFMRKITKITIGKTDTLLMTIKVDIDKVLSEAKFDQVFNFQDFVITGEDSPKFQITNDGIKITEKFDVDINYQNTFGKTVTTNFSDEDIGLDIGLVSTIMFTPYIGIKGDVSIFSGVDNFSLEVGGNVSFEIQVPISIQKQLNTSMIKRIWPIGVKELIYQWNIPICVGIWITIKPSIDGVLDTAVSAELTMSNYGSLRTVQPFFIKFSYNDDINIDSSASLSSSIGDWKFYRNTDLSNIRTRISCDVKASIYFDLSFLLWGFIGPYISFRPYYKFNSNINKVVRSLIYNLKYGPGIDITVGGKFFIFNYDKTLYDNWWYTDNNNLRLKDKKRPLNIIPLDPNRFRLPQRY